MNVLMTVLVTVRLIGQPSANQVTTLKLHEL